MCVAATVAYALAAATTKPFTTAADVLTAVPIAALAAAVVVCWPLRPVRGRGEGTRWPLPGGRGLVPWLVLAAAVVAWELVEYLAPGGRAAHPTLSSMADAVDRHTVAKAIVFAAWLWLGVVVVAAGTPARATDTGRGTAPREGGAPRPGGGDAP